MASSSSSSTSALALTDLVELINSSSGTGSTATSTTHTLPSADSILTTLSTRYKAEQPYINCGHSTLVCINPLRPLENINDASARYYCDRIAGQDEDEDDEDDPDSPRHLGRRRESGVQPHPYEFAARIHLALQRTGKSQGVVLSGLTASGKTYTSRLITSLLLRISTQHSFGTSHHPKVLKLRDQLKASEVLLDAFGSCKTASSPNATRQGRILELHYHQSGSISEDNNDDSTTRILSGAKILTFGFDKSRLNAPIAREERCFHIFYQFIAGASNEERIKYRLLSDPSQYNLLASNGGTYRIENVNDAIEFENLKHSFEVLGFKVKHLEMIYKILSAVLLLGNINFDKGYSGVGGGATTSSGNNDEESLMVSHETRDDFETVCQLLGLPNDELERILVNKTSYIRKEVITTVLSEEGAIKQRDSLMSSLYTILFSYIVESANHRLYPGDESIKKLQRDKNGNSIVLVDIPGFQTKSPGGALLDVDGLGGGAGQKRNTLIQTYEDDGFDEFIINYQNELLQHWLHRHYFSSGEEHNSNSTAASNNDFIKDSISDGVEYPQVDNVDTSEMTLELLRGGALNSRADSKLGGLLSNLNKTCSSLRKGKIVTEQAADESFIDSCEERYRGHSRFIPRPAGSSGITGTSFAIKHYTGTVSYSAKQFIEKDLDLLDSEFVRLFRSSSSFPSATGSENTFLSKLFSGPSLAAESHPRDTSVLVATQISTQPLRRLSPLKVSRTSSTSVPSDPPEPDIEPISSQVNRTLTEILNILNEVPIWNIHCLRPNDHSSPGIFDIRRIKSQIEACDLKNLLARKRVEYIDSVEIKSFIKRYSKIGASGGANSENVESFLKSRKFEDAAAKGGRTLFFVGNNSVWLSYQAWFNLEMGLVNYETRELAKKRKILAETKESLEGNNTSSSLEDMDGRPPGFSGLEPSPSQDTFHGVGIGDTKAGFYAGESSDDLLKNAGSAGGYAGHGHGHGQLGMPTLPYDAGGHHHLGPGNPAYLRQSTNSFNAGVGDVWGSDLKTQAQPVSPGYSGGGGGGHDGRKGAEKGDGGNDKKGQTVEEVPTSRARRLWLILVWTLTWWIPGFLLGWIGRMKRPDVRIAWREKVALCMLVAFFCGLLLFLILGLGLVLCPQFNYAWNAKELSYHQGRADVWVAVAGKVYDISKFYKAQHSDIVGADVTSDDMLTLAGKDLTPYFPVPLTLGCGDFVTNDRVFLQNANLTVDVPTAFHYSGRQQPAATSELRNADWYTARFLPKMKQYYKGPMVYTKGQLQKGADDDQRIWAMYNKRVYDISDYIYTIKTMNDDNTYRFLPSALTDIFEQQPGTDITQAVDDLDERSLNATTKAQALFCLDNTFYRGEFDFRVTPRCTVQSYFLLAFSIVLITTIAAKFVAALQITKKRNPELQDKFVICQVPCYTEGEESLKKTIDSLANLKYDDKRKLLFVICDGMIVGSGNDRPTPRIVLDILGVENLDPDPLLFKSLGQGNRQLNYGKVYSGLYEFEGHVLPYIVVVKVGKPTERSRPGNRGKRDSQILVMRFLNRVHFDSEMAPLELEIYHQIKNVIGVDPKLYEFLLTVDADTEVKPDSLNRLIAVAADDSSIIGLCGETKLSNEQESWWTMIQVYEYYISHHLAKAFESLFGSVTCLPGCFTLFRLRTTDKGRPLLISNLVIDDYSENEVDTLHKKNLLHLGEDRYLTTLMLKHFPHFKTKFASDARAMTAAPEKWNVLLSQRRRWINSTVHNLFELVALKDLCGFCCFSMRFIVIIDLLGTILLPATMVYLIYLIVTVATHKASVPIISLVMIGAVYGLQVIIFLLKRQWQFLGWLVVYILAYPIYSFFLPIYAFWHFDDFSWGNTRIVVGEGKNKKILAGDDDKFDDSMIPMRKFSEYQQAAWNTHQIGTSPGAMTTGFSDQQRGHSPHGSMGMPGGGYPGPYQHSRAGSRSASVASFPMAAASVANFPMGPQPVFSPFNQQQYGGYGSPAGSIIGGGGSDYGGASRAPMPPGAAFGQNPFRQSTMSFAPSQFGGPGSMLGMPSQFLGQPMPGFDPATARNSTYSLTQWAGPAHRASQSMTTLNPFADGSQMPQAANPVNPTDAELVQALRVYLRTQDLLQVTKRSTREAMAAHFDQADLSKRKNFLNQTIDSILQGQL